MPRYETPCAHLDCENTCAGHKWGHIKAQGDGWFFQRDGKAYCPEHVPAWVTAWRNEKRVDS